MIKHKRPLVPQNRLCWRSSKPDITPDSDSLLDVIPEDFLQSIDLELGVDELLGPEPDEEPVE